MGTVQIDPRRWGNVLQRLQQSSSEAVRFAVQAEMNAEALDQVEEQHAAQLQSILQPKPPDGGKPAPKRKLAAVEPEGQAAKK